MTTAPVQSLRAAQAVASRGRLARGVSAAGLALAVGGVISVAAVGASKWFGWELPWWLALAVPSVVAGSLGFVTGWRRTDRLIASAAKLDEAMGWRDRVSSAIGFGEAKGPFEAIAVSEAESLAASARPERAVEIRFGPPWSFWAGSLAVATAAFAFVPTSIEEQGPDARELERREAAADQIDEAVRDVQREVQGEELFASDDEENVDGASEEELAAFDEIQRALAEGEIDADEALGQAAEAVEQKASELEARADAERDATDALSEAASGAEPEDERVQELADKLSQGDLAAARDAAREMLDQTDRLSPEERDRLAKGLEDLADALDAERAESEQSLPGAGAPEGGSERGATPPPTLEELTERLRQEGLNEDAARDAAQKELERQQREEAERQAADDARRLSEALRETADEVREDGASEDASVDEQTGDRLEPEVSEGEGEQGTAPQGEGETPSEAQTDSDQATDPSQSEGTSGDQEGSPQGGSESEDASGRSPQDANDPTNPAAREGDPAGGEPNSSEGGSDAAEPAEDVSGGQGAEDATRGDVGEGQRQAADPNEQGTERGTQQQPGSQPGEQPSSRPADPNQQQPAGEQPGGEQPGGEQPGGEQPSGEQPGDEQPGDEQPGDEQPGGEQPGGEQPEPEQSGGEQSGDEQAGGEQAGGEQSEGGQSPDGAPPEGGQPNPDGSGQGTQPSNEPGGDGPGMTPGDAGDSGRDETGESAEGGSSNSDNGKGGSGAGTGDRLNRELDRLAQRQREGEQDRERAQQLRERAEELLSDASPEERARMRELAEQYQRFREESGQGFEDEFFDARGESREAPVEGSGQKADLLEDVPGQGGASTSSTLSEQTVREAADGAERAIEQQGVPRRLHRYVRDVYRRFVETAEQTEKGLAPIGPDADSGGSGGDD
ncbi:MAG: hypothetical protein AAGI53_00860 [Planctomycetota bacterium]